MEQRELLYTADGNAKWYGHIGKPFGSFLRTSTYIYHMLQPFRSRVFTPKERNPMSICKTYVSMFIAILSVIGKQEQKVRQQVNEQTNCGRRQTTG